MRAISELTVAIYAVLLLILLPDAKGQSAPAPTTSPCEITVKTDKKEYYLGEPIHINVTVHDLSPKGVIFKDFPSESYAVTWNGKPVEQTRWSRLDPERNMQSISHGAVILGKYESYTHTVLLSQWVDVSTPGQYELIVSRMVGEVLGQDFQAIHSNRVTFEIKDIEPPPSSGRPSTTSATGR